MSNRVTEFETLLTSFIEDYLKFIEKGNNTAGPRARKSLQDIRNLAKEVRDEISSTKKQKTTV